MNKVFFIIYLRSIIESSKKSQIEWSNTTPLKRSRIIAKYKTAVVANRMIYIGNIESEDQDGNKEVRGDAIIKSPVNKFDTFPKYNFIDKMVISGYEPSASVGIFVHKVLEIISSSPFCNSSWMVSFAFIVGVDDDDGSRAEFLGLGSDEIPLSEPSESFKHNSL